MAQGRPAKAYIYIVRLTYQGYFRNLRAGTEAVYHAVDDVAKLSIWGPRAQGRQLFTLSFLKRLRQLFTLSFS